MGYAAFIVGREAQGPVFGARDGSSTIDELFVCLAGPNEMVKSGFCPPGMDGQIEIWEVDSELNKVGDDPTHSFKLGEMPENEAADSFLERVDAANADRFGGEEVVDTSKGTAFGGPGIGAVDRLQDE